MPGIIVFCSSVAYFSAAIVSLESSATLPVLVHHEGIVRPQQPFGEAVGVAERVAERHAERMAALLQLLAEIEELVEVVGDLGVADLVHPGLAIQHRTGAAADRDADPVLGVPLAAVEQRQVVPAAVLGAEVVGEIGQFDQLVGVDVRIGAEADERCRRRRRCWRPRQAAAEDLPSSRSPPSRPRRSASMNFLVLAFQIHLVRIDELRRADHVQRCALLDLEFRRLHVRRRHVVEPPLCAPMIGIDAAPSAAAPRASESRRVMVIR